MTPLFRKKRAGKTLLILDVESGSVGAALVYVPPGDTTEKPRLFGDVRVELPLGRTHHAEALSTHVVRAAREALHHAAQVAARVRTHETAGSIGEVGGIAVFLSAPWASVHLHTVRYARNAPFYLSADMLHKVANDAVKREKFPEGSVVIDRMLTGIHIDEKPVDHIPETKAKSVECTVVTAVAPRTLLQGVREALEEHFDGVPTTFHSFGAAAAHATNTLFPEHTECLVCAVRGETAELLLTREDGLMGYASVPTGYRTLLRTLETHAGLSAGEARSLLRLSRHGELPHQEALHASHQHFASHIRASARELLDAASLVGGAFGVFIIAPVGAGEHYARALAEDEALADLLPEGVVRAIRPQHMSGHVATHMHMGDTPLLLEALFVDARFGALY